MRGDDVAVPNMDHVIQMMMPSAQVHQSPEVVVTSPQMRPRMTLSTPVAVISTPATVTSNSTPPTVTNSSTPVYAMTPTSVRAKNVTRTLFRRTVGQDKLIVRESEV